MTGHVVTAFCRTGSYGTAAASASTLFAARVNDDHHSSIRLLPHNLGLFHRRIHHRTRRHQKLRRAVSVRLDLRGINSHHAYQIILHAIRAALAEIQIVFVAAKRVCVTFNRKCRLRIASDQRASFCSCSTELACNSALSYWKS